MSFVLSEDQELIRRTVRELAASDIANNAVAADRDMRFPKENVAGLASLGLLGVMVPAEQGGAGADAVTLALACEELSARCGTTGTFAAVTNAWLTTPLARHATDALRDAWLPKLLSGEALGTYGLHEDAVGGDPYRIRSSARPVANGDEEGITPADAASEAGPAILSGTKDLVLLAGMADVTIVVARRGQDSAHRRVDAYAIPTDRHGVIWGSDESKLGLRGYPSGPLYLNKVDVTADDMLGRPGQGGDLARECGQILAIGMAASCVGLARAALEAAVEFANEREQFGQPIARFEAIQHNIATMRVSVDAGRNMVLAAAATFDRDGTAPVEVNAANIHATELARESTRMAIRTHGGAGFMREVPVERFARDVRTIAAMGRGTLVSKSLLGMHELRIEDTA